MSLAGGLLLAPAQQAAAAVAKPTAISTAPYSLSANYTKYSDLNKALDAKLPNMSVHSVMKDANHDRRSLGSVPLAGLEAGFRFDSADDNDCRSYPQGIATSRDSGGYSGRNYDGHQLVMVSWYTKTKCGGSGSRSRITLVDWDATWANTYRKILLVEPTGTASSPSYKDVNVHAGGIVWYGDYLYVADTSHGLRVFDMRKIWKTSTSGSESLIGRQSDGSYKAHNYKYVLPQVGTITDTSTGSDKVRWSTISLDRVSDSVVMTEYTCKARTSTGICSTTPVRKPRAVRYPFAAGKTTFAATTTATQALLLPYYRLNGVASHNNRWWFNSSGYTTMYYWAGGAASAYNWVSGGESISYWEDPNSADLLWTMQEGTGKRNVFAVKQASYNG